MEQISKLYGNFLLEATAFALLLVLLFAGLADNEGNRGILTMIGKQVSKEENAISKDDIEIYQNEAQKAYPVITYVDTGSLRVGEYAFGAMFQALDWQGQALEVRLCSICDPAGTERIGEYGTQVTRLNFPIPGIYVVEVTAEDAWNRRSTYRIRIPVNG